MSEIRSKLRLSGILLIPEHSQKLKVSEDLKSKDFGFQKARLSLTLGCGKLKEFLISVTTIKTQQNKRFIKD
jgi:hypothetical protein